MSRAIAAFHGAFGRATVYSVDRDFLPHAHREGHLIFYVDGATHELTIDGRAQRLSRAVVGAVNPWQAHSLLVNPLEPGMLCLVLYIRQQWFQSQSRESQLPAMRFGSPFIRLTHEARLMVERVVDGMLDLDSTARFETDLFDLTEACFDMSWHAVPAPTSRLGARLAGHDSRISRSLRLMAEGLNLGDRLLFERIARQAGLSRPHFFKLFREHLGLTPNLYLNTLRMERALTRLTRSRDQITTIGLDLGFSSQASFSRFFVSNVGIPPSNYRRVAHWFEGESAASAPAQDSA
ncbi:MAG: AraC family transcriptional regulator [Burkholderiaceae bacterium]